MREVITHEALEGVPVTGTASLSVTGVCYGASDSPLIKNISLSLPARGISVIMGPNGAGKSLFLRLIHGLLVPSAGTIRWGGLSIDSPDAPVQALVFQSPVLLRRSTAANVDFVLKTRGRPDREKRDALLQRVGLSHLAKSPARRLSGGECQRLQLARALATDPDVLLMDEPTASLDPASTAVIEALVQDIARKGCKVIYVTHDLGQARRLADDVVFLANGKLAEHSSAQQFFETPVSDAARAYVNGHLVL